MQLEEPLLAVSRPAPAEGLLFATNQLNLASILSAGYLKPRSGFTKYYRDLLDVSNGWIPLFRGAVGTDLTALLSDDLLRPVLIELSSDIPARVPVAYHGPKRHVAIADPLSVSEIVAIHFRSEDDKSEVLARSYEGINYNWFSLRVSPALFNSSSSSDAAWLKKLPTTDDQRDYQRVDRLAGAIAAVLAMRSTSGVEAGDLGFLLGLSSGSAKARTYRGLHELDQVDEPTKTLDAILLAASVRVLLRTDRHKNWDPARIVREIRDEVAHANGSAPEEVVALLRDIWRVVRLESEFQGFGQREGSAAATALLWALNRPDPEAMRDESYAGESQWIQIAVATLVGILNGFELLPDSMRARDVSRLVWDWQAYQLSRGKEQRRLDADIEIREGNWVLSSRGISIAHGVLTNHERPEDDRISEIERNGWEECLRFEVVGSAEDIRLRTRDGRVAIELTGPLSIKRSVINEAYALRVASTAAAKKPHRPEIIK